MKNIIISEIESDLRKLYKENGYVAIKNAISKKSLERLQHDIISLFDKEYGNIKTAASLDKKIIDINDSDKASLHKLQIAATTLSSFYSIVAEVHDFLVQIIPPESDLFHNGLGFVFGIPGSQRLAYDWHQDGTYHGGNGKVTIHIWFPIFYPATIENGAMSLLENSHKLGLLNFENFKFQADGYTTHKISNTEELLKNHLELVCGMDFGDCLFFCDELIHKSNINKTQLCRMAGVMKYSLNPSFEVHSGLVGV